MIVVAALCAILPLVSSKSIVHLFEWSHDDVAKECVRFLRPYGYSGVQVSPVNEYAVLPGRPWSERYQPFSYKIISRSGNETAFRKMVETCNQVRVKVYVDVVFNHMSSNLPPGTKGIGGSHPDPDNKIYPDVPYGPEDFHPFCEIKDWRSPKQIRVCELVGLHDLDQSREHVRGKVVEFLNRLIDIGVAGFRVDAAKHMEPADLAVIYNRTKDLNTKWFPKGTRPYYYQEVPSNPDYDVVTAQEYTSLGGVMDFKYSFEIANAFTRGHQLYRLETFGKTWNLVDWNDSVVFVDNHDSQRAGIFGIDSLTHTKKRQYKMANGFMLAWYHSTAVIMSSYFFNTDSQGPPPYPVPINSNQSCSGGWVCEHRWKQIYGMVHFAKVVKGTPVTNWWTNGNNQISFCRGNKGFIAINAEMGPLHARLQTCLPPGKYCDVVSGRRRGKGCSGLIIQVRRGGNALIRIPAGAEDGFVAIHAQSKISFEAGHHPSKTTSNSSHHGKNIVDENNLRKERK